MDHLETNPTCGRGSRAHRPNKTPSGTNGSGRDIGLAPGNIKPDEPTQRKDENKLYFVKSCKNKFKSNRKTSLYLDHAVTVGVGDVRLQTSKQSSVVVFEIKVLQTQFGVLDCDLM